MKKVGFILVGLLIWSGASIYLWNVYIYPPKVQAYTVTVPRNVDLDKFIGQYNPKLDPGIRQIIIKAITDNATEKGLDPALVASVIARESGFNPLSCNKNRDGSIDHGLMSINDRYQASRIKKRGLATADLYHINTSVDLGTDIIKENVTRFVNVRSALQAYVGQSHKTYVSDVLSTYGEMQWESR